MEGEIQAARVPRIKGEGQQTCDLHLRALKGEVLKPVEKASNAMQNLTRIADVDQAQGLNIAAACHKLKSATNSGCRHASAWGA